MYTISMMKQSY